MSTQGPRPTMTRQTVEASFAEHAYHRSTTDHTNNSNRARNYTLSKKLIALYMEKFKMDARQAKEAVELEMADKYAPNPWDTPAPASRKYQQRRNAPKDISDEKMESVQGSRSTVHSEEQWDLFEKWLK